MILQAMFETYSDEMYLACLSVMRFGGGTSKSFEWNLKLSISPTKLYKLQSHVLCLGR